ncbi:hypothetical protein SAY86_031195 [Trapa natans]|uniref:Uncharacterized protein n=1 Tax=Trapa natans TaxID=22666 RepID=A0AAN7LRF2_TRANT|nr:hypothetical protein SAY86_031195 [Trapa natans]
MTAVAGEWMMAAKEEQAVAAMSLACTVISPHDDGGEAEASDSNSSTLPHNPGKRRTKVSSSSSSSSSRFKGVVPQQNGNWGAQIYANHQRIWLGTFKSEEAAAMAYDSAAIKLRSGDPHRNIPWTLDESMAEHNFQSLFSQEAVLSMIKDGSYRSKFANYIRVVESERHNKVARLNTDFVQQKEGEGGAGFLCRQLFQKELTPSDVGKLNRLVIPKKYAVKYLPLINGNCAGGCGGETTNNNIDDVQLIFYDRSMRMWKFRYCYWSSSQSFVLTRGWSRFVKEKFLRANDIVGFYICECTQQHHHHEGPLNGKNRTFCMIDVFRNVNRPDQQHLVDWGSVDGGDQRRAGEETVELDECDKDTKLGVKIFGVQFN